MKYFKTPFLKEFCLALSLTLLAQIFAVSQEHINVRDLHRRELHEIDRIRMLPTEFRVLNSRNEMQVVNMSLQSFKLMNDQTYASFATDKVFIDLAEMPAEAILLPEAGFSKATDNKDYLHQIYLSEKSPFTFDPETHAFYGKIEIHPVEGKLEGQTDVARTQIDLLEPFEIIVSAVGIDEKRILVESLNWPPITVDFDFDASNNFLKDNVEIVVKTVQKPDGYITPLSISPYIEVNVEKDQMQGLGIQETPVTLTLQGVSNYPDVSVGIQCTKGYLDPDEVILRANNVTTVSLRSEGTGEARISVIAANLISTSDHIRFMFPWKFLLFSIIGALIGALIHVLRKHKTGFDTRAFVVAILLGFTVSICYWALGVNLLNITIEVSYLNEFAVLALSILGALLGWHIGKKKSTQ